VRLTRSRCRLFRASDPTPPVGAAPLRDLSRRRSPSRSVCRPAALPPGRAG